MVVNKTRQETEVEDEDDLNSSSEGDENGEYVYGYDEFEEVSNVCGRVKKEETYWLEGLRSSNIVAGMTEGTLI